MFFPSISEGEAERCFTNPATVRGVKTVEIVPSIQLFYPTGSAYPVLSTIVFPTCNLLKGIVDHFLFPFVTQTTIEKVPV